jgi:hypothetical protein
LFEAGDYPDKNFTLTEDELNIAAANFQPVANDLQHTNTILDGKLGTLESVYVKGKELFGKVKIPKWLHDLHPNAIKTSLTWSRDDKRIRGNALVLNPRVPDAQIVAAFEAYDRESELDNQNIKTKPKEAKMPVTETIDVTKNTFTKDEVLELIKESKVAFSNETEELRKKNAALEFSIKAQSVDKTIEDLKRAGKLLPANEALAKAIMMSGDSQVVTFDDKETSVAALFAAYVVASPVIVKFDEQCKHGISANDEPTPAVIEMANKMDIDPKAMMKYMED